MTTALVLPKSTTTRAYGQATVLVRQGTGLTTADAALVTPYVPGTSTPYPNPLYGDPDTLTPLVFPVPTGSDGVVALWADAPGRLELYATGSGMGAGRVVLDLEPVPAAAPPPVDLSGYYTKGESDAAFLSQDEADALYLPADYVPPASGISQADADLRYVNTAGDTMTGLLIGPGYYGNAPTGGKLYLDGPAGTNRLIYLMTGGTSRWSLYASPAAETGSNAGSNLEVIRYDDAGNGIATALTLSRATGAATFGGDVHPASGYAQFLGSDANPWYRVNTMWLASPTSLYLHAGGGGAVLPSADNTLAFGTPEARWQWIYSIRGNFRDGLDVTGKPVAVSPTAGNALTWDATGFYAPAGGSGAYLPLTGGTLTGPLSVANYLVVNGGLSWMMLDQAPGGDSRFAFRTDVGQHRWNIAKTSAAETGSNAGSNLDIWRFDDAGNSLGTALSLNRATGAATFGGAVTTTGLITGGQLQSSGAGAALILDNRDMAGNWVQYAQSGVLAWFNGANRMSLTGTGDLTTMGGLTVAGKPVAVSPAAGNALTWDATGLWAPAGGGGGAFVDEAGDTMTGPLVLQGASATANVLQAKLAADTQPRFRADASGKLEWGNGGATAPDVSLSRPASNQLALEATTIPLTDNVYTLGTNTARWAQVIARLLTLYHDSGALTIGITNPAAAGAVRLRNTATVGWRNAANGGDLTLSMNASDQLALAVGAGSLTTTAPTAGGAGALPATPTGYLTVVLNGTARRLPYYT